MAWTHEKRLWINNHQGGKHDEEEIFNSIMGSGQNEAVVYYLNRQSY